MQGHAGQRRTPAAAPQRHQDRDHDVGVGPAVVTVTMPAISTPMLPTVSADLHVGALDGQAVLGIRPKHEDDDGVGDRAREGRDDHRHAGHASGASPGRFERLVEDESATPSSRAALATAVSTSARCQPWSPVRRRAAAARRQYRCQPHEHRDQMGSACGPHRRAARWS